MDALVKIAVIFLFTAFMPITAVSFLVFRLKQKKEQYSKILVTLGLKDENRPEQGDSLVPTMETEYSWGDYLLPVGFCTVICLVGSIMLVAGGDVYADRTGECADRKPAMPFLSGILFTTDNGIHCKKDDEDYSPIRVQQLGSIVVLAFAFLGGFVWSAQNVLRRLTTVDLAPATYYGSGVRIIYACLIALMLLFLLGTSGTEQYIVVVAFLAGMFPERALNFLREKVKIFSRHQGAADELPLEMIEGINLFHISRLNEIGIDNAQNLARSSLIDILLKTPFNAMQIIDWIAQAMLCVYFKDGIHSLRNIGVRTVFDLRAADASNIDAIAQQVDFLEKASNSSVNPSPLRVKLVYEWVKKDPTITMLEGFQDRLSGYRATSEE